MSLEHYGVISHDIKNADPEDSQQSSALHFYLSVILPERV